MFLVPNGLEFKAQRGMVFLILTLLSTTTAKIVEFWEKWSNF